MSKKLIAVASAAALALTALVGVAPASASVPTITETSTGSTGSGTAASPFVVDVPDTGTVRVATDATAISIEAGSLAIGDVVTFTSTGPVKLVESEITAAQLNILIKDLGKQSFTYTKSNTNAVTIYAFTTSTVAGTVVATINRPGSASISETFHIEGETGVKYNVTNVTGMPVSMTATGTAVVAFQVTDAFGNLVEASSVISDTNTRLNTGIPAWNASKKVYETTVTSTGTSAFVASLDIGAATVSGLGSPADSFSGVINNSAAVSQVTTLTSQVAALTTQLTAATKKFNKLAKRWNRANPSNKVKLMK